MKLEPSLETLQKQIELRVLLGPQAGSRLTLSSGNYELGAGDDCAIILSGPKVENCHARIEFDGETASITPLEGKISDAQGGEITETLVLTLGMPLEIGGIWISVDDVDAEWPNPTDVVPVMPAMPHAAPEPTAPEVAADVEPETGSNRKVSRFRRMFVVLVSFLGISTAAIAALLIWANVGEQHAKQPPITTRAVLADPPSMKKVRDIVASSGIGATIEISATRDRKVQVRGFVPDDRTAKSLQLALADVSPPPTVELHIDSLLMENAAQLIAEKIDAGRAKLKVESVTGGVLTLEGAVVSQSVRESIMDLLHAGLPDLKHVNASIVLAEDLPQILQDQLAETGLLKKMQIIDRQPEFILRGSLTEEDMQRWESLIVKFSEKYGKLLPVKATIKLTYRKPPVHVQAIVGGNTPFVITESGDRVTRGGDINGNTLLIVKDNEIIFEGSEKFRIAR